jgi:hypothetical protein
MNEHETNFWGGHEPLTLKDKKYSNYKSLEIKVPKDFAKFTTIFTDEGKQK